MAIVLDYRPENWHGTLSTPENAVHKQFAAKQHMQVLGLPDSRVPPKDCSR